MPAKSIFYLSLLEAKLLLRSLAENMVKNVLVIECTTTYNWYKIFDGATLTNGEQIKIEQATWQEINCTGYFDSGLIVEMRPGLLHCVYSLDIHLIIHIVYIVYSSTSIRKYTTKSIKNNETRFCFNSNIGTIFE